ncbi:MAG: hypothetical protein ACP5RK_01555 [Candidatus Micrarchaeia archaeon]
MRHAYYDIAYFDCKELGMLLGYKKVLAIGKDISFNEKGEHIIIADTMWKNFPNKNDVVGVVASKVDKAFFQKLREEEKILIIDVSPLNKDFVKESKRLRGVLKNALHFKLKTALATFAKEKTYFLSSAQMLEIAKFLGASEEQAKDLLSAIGEIL